MTRPGFEPGPPQWEARDKPLSHSSGYEEFYHLGYDSLWSIGNQLMFCLLPANAGFFLGLFFDSENGGGMFFQNVDFQLVTQDFIPVGRTVLRLLLATVLLTLHTITYAWKLLFIPY
jgi:hypothetical protein